jgi:hypothetical protein
MLLSKGTTSQESRCDMTVDAGDIIFTSSLFEVDERGKNRTDGERAKEIAVENSCCRTLYRGNTASSLRHVPSVEQYNAIQRNTTQCINTALQCSYSALHPPSGARGLARRGRCWSRSRRSPLSRPRHRGGAASACPAARAHGASCCASCRRRSAVAFARNHGCYTSPMRTLTSGFYWLE